MRYCLFLFVLAIAAILEVGCEQQEVLQKPQVNSESEFAEEHTTNDTPLLLDNEPLLLLDDEPEALSSDGSQADNSRCFVCHVNYMQEDIAVAHARADIGCANCHVGSALGGQSFERMGLKGDYFRDRGDIKEVDAGQFNFTGREEDRFKFKVPTLRNIAVTFPYFHDGKTDNLKDAVLVMSKYQEGRQLSDEEADLIVAFLGTLTGEYEGKPVQ